MPTTPTNTIYPDNSTEKPCDISKALLAGNVSSEDCPWVKIGNLYVSVTITGESSWLPLISLLHEEGKRKFTVFSGRHGDIPNIVDQSNDKTILVFDEGHMDEDNAVKTNALKEFPDISIEIVDSGAQQIDHAAWLAKETKTHLDADSVVIYAWCYSLFTMSEIKMAVTGDGKEIYESESYQDAQKAEFSKSIADTLNANFSWAL